MSPVLCVCSLTLCSRRSRTAYITNARQGLQLHIWRSKEIRYLYIHGGAYYRDSLLRSNEICYPPKLGGVLRTLHRRCFWANEPGFGYNGFATWCKNALIVDEQADWIVRFLVQPGNINVPLRGIHWLATILVVCQIFSFSGHCQPLCKRFVFSFKITSTLSRLRALSWPRIRQNNWKYVYEILLCVMHMLMLWLKTRAL